MRGSRRARLVVLAAALTMGGLGAVPSLTTGAKAAILAPGSPDPTFGRDGSGLVTNDAMPGANVELAVATAVDSQRRVYTAVSDFGGEQTINVTRTTTDGVLDHTFGVRGVVSRQIVTNPDEVRTVDVAVDSKDRVIVAGWRLAGGQSHVVLARFDKKGAADTSFNSTGMNLFTFGGVSGTQPRAILVDPNDNILVVGNDQIVASILRVDESGQLDTAFGGGDGVAKFNEYNGSSLWTTQYLAAGFASDAVNGDHIVATGYADTGAGHPEVLLHRYSLNGANIGFAAEPDGAFDLVGPGGGFGVGVASFDNDGYVVGVQQGSAQGSAIKVDSNGNPVTAFGGSGTGVRDLGALTVADVAARGSALYISGYTSAPNRARVRALDPGDGSDNTAFAGNGEAAFEILDVPTTYGPALTIDGAGRLVMGWSNNAALPRTHRLARLTSPTPPPAKSATKIYFNENSALYSMSSDGTDVVSLASPPPVPAGATLTYTAPQSDFAGDVIFQRNYDPVGPQGLERRIYQVNPADPASPTQVSEQVPGLTTADAVNPSLAVNPDGQAFAGFIAANGTGCGYRRALDGSFFNSTATMQPFACTFADFELHPNDANRFVGVRNGKLVAGSFGAPLTEVAVGYSPVTEVEWGLDGEIAVFSFPSGSQTVLAWVNASDFTNPNPEVHVIYGDNGLGQLTFAPSPDRADPSVMLSVLVGGQYEMMKVPLAGGPLQDVRFGQLIGVGDWDRNFTAYVAGSVSYAPASVAATSVPGVQGGSPSSQQAPGADPNVVKAGLLKMSLLDSGLLKLSLLDSGLLKLSLLDSGLLKLSLLDSGLLKLSLLDSGGAAPKVAQGLDQINLAMLPIVSAGAGGDNRGWRERILDVGGKEATALSKLPLTDISLGDVLRLSGPKKFEMPAVDQLDLSNSVFGTLNSMSFLLGGTRLSQIRGFDCRVLESLPDGANCGQNYGGMNATLLALQIAGVNLDGLDLDGNTANGPDLSALPYSAFTLDRATSLLPDVLLDSVTPKLNRATLGGLDIADLPAGIAECGTPEFDCTGKKLGDAHVADRIADTASFGDLGDLGAAGDNLPMYEVILGLIGSPVDDPFDKSPSQLGITPELGGNAPRFGVTFSRAGMGWGITRNPTVEVTLPAGFRYEAGSAQLDGVTIADPLGGGDGPLSFDLSVDVGSLDVIRLSFGAFAVDPPAATPQNYADTSLAAKISDGSFSQTVGSDQVSVGDHFEIGDQVDCDDENWLDPDTLYFSRLEPRGEDQSPDVDYFCIDPPEAGSIVTVYLNQLKYDADLALFHPQNPSTPGSPLRDISVQTPQMKSLDDAGETVYNGGEPLVTDGEADLPLPAGLPVAGISNNRGTKAERVEAITWGPGQNEGDKMFVQVSGNNGAGGDDTYALRYTVTPPKTATPGPARTNFNHGLAAGSASLPAQLDSVILHAPERFEDLYGAQAADAVAAKVADLAAATNGVVFNVDNVAAVVAAFEAADATPGLPDVHNAVVRAINDAVDAYLGARRSEVDNIVVVGSDEVIPFARLMDLSQTANEQTFVEELKHAASNQAPALIGSALASRILSDDPYGAFTPRPFGGTYLYVPDVALGRLVETPEQINAVISEFLHETNAGEGPGVLHPNKTLSAGYDFMTKLAQSIRDSFAAQMPDATATNLISNTWNRSDITAALVGGGDAADLIAVNAHYAPTFLVPASRSDENFQTAPDLPAATIADSADFRRKLFLTMGCHSGYSITNYLTGAGNAADWPEALSADAIGAFVGNTGYGLGLKDVNAFSQTLFADFATFLGHASLGGALQLAKQEYLANGITNPYDYKVVQQAVFYGLPQYRIAGTTPLPAPAAGPTTSLDDISGLQAASVARSMPIGDGDKWDLTETADGGFWTYDGGRHAIAQHRPIQPAVTTEATRPGLVARGVMVTGARIGADQSFDPLLARPVISDGEREPEIQFGDVLYPARLAEISNYGEDGSRQRLQLVPAQFRGSTIDDEGKLVGVERRYDQLSTQIFYLSRGAESDTTAPVLSDPLATLTAGTTEFSVRVADAESDISRVTVLYRRRSAATKDFALAELVADPFNPGRWFTGVELDDDVEFLFQAVNSDALVGSISNHGALFDEVTEIVADPTGAADLVTVSADKNPTNGFYDGDVKVSFDSELGLPITVSEVESGAAHGATVTASADGRHTYVFESTSNDPNVAGDSGVFAVNIDSTKPVVDIDTPGAGATYSVGDALAVDFTCDDLHLASCVAQDSNGETLNDGDPLDTSVVGARSFTVRGADAFGHVTEVVNHFTVEEAVDSLAVTVKGQPLDDQYGEAIDVVITSTKPAATLTVKVTENGGTPTVSTHTGSATIRLDNDAAYTLEYSSSRGASGSDDVTVDLNAPTVSIASPTNGATRVVGDAAPADFACKDRTLVACVGTPLDTATPTSAAPRQFTVTATDAFGRTAQKTHDYFVRYADGGACGTGVSHRFTQPKDGRVAVLPGNGVATVRFALCDVHGVVPPNRMGNIGPPINVATGEPAPGSCGKLLGLIRLCLPLLNPVDTQFTFDSTGQWRFIQDTSRLALGTHKFRVLLPDGTNMDYTVKVTLTP